MYSVYYNTLYSIYYTLYTINLHIKYNTYCISYTINVQYTIMHTTRYIVYYKCILFTIQCALYTVHSIPVVGEEEGPLCGEDLGLNDFFFHGQHVHVNRLRYKPLKRHQRREIQLRS